MNHGFLENPLPGVSALQYCLLWKIVIPLIRNELSESIAGPFETIYEGSEFMTDVIQNFRNTYFTALQRCAMLTTIYLCALDKCFMSYILSLISSYSVLGLVTLRFDSFSAPGRHRLNLFLQCALPYLAPGFLKFIKKLIKFSDIGLMFLTS